MYLCKSIVALEEYLLTKGIITNTEKYLVTKGYFDDLGIYGRGAFCVKDTYIEITSFKNREAFLVK